MSTLQQSAWSEGYRQAMSELKPELDRLRAQDAFHVEACGAHQKHIDELSAENDRLRAEHAAIEAAAIERCAQRCDSFEEPHMARLIRKLAKAANETDGEMSLFYERLKKANEEIDRLRAEKAMLLEAISLIEQRSECSWTRMHCRALLAKVNDPKTEPYEPPPYDWGKDKK